MSKAKELVSAGGEPFEGLTPMQKAFVEEYISNGLQGVAAYKAINPDASDTVASTGAYQFLQKPHVKQYLIYLMDELGLSDMHCNMELIRLMKDPNPFVRLAAIKLVKQMNGKLDKVLKLETSSKAVIVIGGKTLSDE